MGVPGSTCKRPHLAAVDSGGAGKVGTVVKRVYIVTLLRCRTERKMAGASEGRPPARPARGEAGPAEEGVRGAPGPSRPVISHQPFLITT
jgi:hypothetical protein